MALYPGPRATPLLLRDICFLASLPGEFLSLLISSGNHGIGLGITDYRPVLTAVGVSTNAILYTLLILLGRPLIAGIRHSKRHKQSGAGAD